MSTPIKSLRLRGVTFFAVILASSLGLTAAVAIADHIVTSPTTVGQGSTYDISVTVTSNDNQIGRVVLLDNNPGSVINYCGYDSVNDHFGSIIGGNSCYWDMTLASGAADHFVINVTDPPGCPPNGSVSLTSYVQHFSSPSSYNPTHFESATHNYAQVTGCGGGQSNLSAPANLVATSPTLAPAVLSWDAVSGATSYNIYRDDSQTPAIIGITETSYTDNDAALGGHTYYVTAVDASGESDQSNTVTINVVPPPPSAPTDLSATSPTLTPAELVWNPVDDATSYNIYRNGSLLASSPFNSYTDHSAVSVNTYSYYVTAVDGDSSESDPSNTVSVFVVPVHPPTPTLAATSPIPAPVLTWSTVPRATSYNIYRDDDPTPIGTATGGSYKDSDATLGDHTYYITAVNAGGESSPSNTVNITVLAGSTSDISVTVSANDNQSGRIVILDNNPGSVINYCGYDTAADHLGYIVNGNSCYWDIGVSSGNADHFVINVSDFAGYCTQNGSIALTTYFQHFSTYPSYDPTHFQSTTRNYGCGDSTVVPANLVAVSPTPSPALTWDAVSGASSYNIYRYGVLLSTSTTNSYTDNSAVPGEYIYYVTAVNSSGESGQSNSIDVVVSLPDAPTNLTAQSPAQFPSLNWDSVSSADSYNIYRDGNLVGSSTTNSFIDSTATANNAYDYYVTAVNHAGESGSSNSVSVFVGLTVTFTSGNTKAVNARDMLNFTVTTSGTPAPSINESGALPSGVTFTDNGDGTASLSGIPALGATGNYPISMTATNGVGDPATQDFTLTVNTTNFSPTIVSDGSYTATYGSAFSFMVNTTGYPAPTITKTGTLPTGVTFKDNHDGTATISGTPSGTANGNYSLNIKAKNSQGTANQAFALTVTKAPVLKKIPNKTTIVGTAFSLAVSASGTETPSLSVTGLPDGLVFTDNGNGTGTISGTPAAGGGGSYTATFTATNSFGSASQNFTIKNNEAPTITSATSASATVGTAFSFAVTSTGYSAPTVSKSGTLPAGITFHAATDTFSGTPHAGSAGTYPITITAHNATGIVTQSFVLTVYP